MFIRTKANPGGRSLSLPAARRIFIGIYVLYPLGCLLQMLPESWEGETAASVAGLLMIAGVFILFAVLAGSSLQRQAQEPESVLDERESAERNRATYQAHAIFSGVVLMGVLYLMLTADLADAGKLDLWRPTSGGHWNGIFGGLILLSFTLPGAILAFRQAPPEEE
ncbi:hypothetical protein [Hyphomonas sp.]|uniref:hypothetical protein n=1 Tax=Hyphomonas sp. TaxID=87 RepID=UPI00391A0500